MKIAVTYENGQVFQHFGHTAQMKLYEVENGQIVGEEVADTTGSGHGALAQAGIRLCGGVSGSADQAVRALLAGELDYSAEAHCDHHDDSDHECHHGDCGEDKQGCAGNGCGE